jgi:TolB protein
MRRIVCACAVMILAACSTGGSNSRDGGARSSAASASPSERSPSPSAAGSPIDIASLTGRIVFSDDTNDIWSMKADGTHVRRLTSAPALEFDPTWSPDGRRIAYRHQSGDDRTTEIYAMDADGTHRLRLTRNDVADWGPDWSPDGRRIVWNSSVGTGGFGFFGYVIAPDGTGLRRITRHYIEYPAWSPDGSRIAFMAQEAGAVGNNPNYNIFVMDADGSHVRRLTTMEGEDGWPAWSPDGKRIAFSSARDDCSISDAPDCRTTGDVGPWADVWIMNADGTEQRRVTSEFGQFFTWSPDGSAILVTGDETYLIRADGNGLTPFPVEGVSHPLFPDWIPA